ncbi:MAG: hypothetical protein IT326_01170 [Anaerolineae bacterium]|nr:hypothetical protein [Anaerolineae bacterium]
MFAKKIDAQVRIGLAGGEVRDGVMCFIPGAAIRGKAEITVEEDLTADHVWIRLEWFTEGRGDRDAQTIEEIDAYQGVMTGGTPQTVDFAFTLPEAPWSYAGHYINIIWAITVHVDRSRTFKEITYHERFVMAPDRHAVTP